MRITQSKLTWKDTLVYSYLVYRHNINQPTTIKQVSDAIGLDRKRTVPASIDRLGKDGLVEHLGHNTGYQPKEPAGAVSQSFIFKAKAEQHWWRRFAYFDLQLPTQHCPLSPLENMTYWKLKSLVSQQQCWQTPVGLGTILGCSKNSVVKAVVALQNLNLLKTSESYKGGWDVEVHDAPKEWFVQPEPKIVREKTWGDSPYASILQNILAEDPDNPWLQGKFPEIFLKLVDGKVPEVVARCVLDAKQGHAQKGTAKTCAYLLKWRLEQLNKRMRKIDAKVKAKEAAEDRREANRQAEYKAMAAKLASIGLVAGVPKGCEHPWGYWDEQPAPKDEEIVVKIKDLFSQAVIKFREQTWICNHCEASDVITLLDIAIPAQYGDGWGFQTFAVEIARRKKEHYIIDTHLGDTNDTRPMPKAADDDEGDFMRWLRRDNTA
jgi:hypothetical protein